MEQEEYEEFYDKAYWSESPPEMPLGLSLLDHCAWLGGFYDRFGFTYWEHKGIKPFRPLVSEKY